MIDKCPECSSPVYGNRCGCGWENDVKQNVMDPTDYVECQEGIMARRCVVWDAGQRCPNPGTSSPSMGKDSTFYCTKHRRKTG